MADQMIIKYNEIDNSANNISIHNTNLKSDLEDIRNLITGLQGDYESNAAVRIREKINGMMPRFEQYYNVVDNYVKFLRNMVIDYKTTEQTNTTNADQFI